VPLGVMSNVYTRPTTGHQHSAPPVSSGHYNPRSAAFYSPLVHQYPHTIGGEEEGGEARERHGRYTFEKECKWEEIKEKVGRWCEH
jgi:hypothetical protein